MESANSVITEAQAASGNHILAIRGLKTYFFTSEGIVRAVDGVDLTIRRGTVMGLVGESGCGKSITSLSILRLVPPPGRIVEGQIWLNNEELLSLDSSQVYSVRGSKVAMIFQEPMTSLNPVFTVGSQIEEAILAHQTLPKQEARAQAIEMLRRVGIPEPEKRFRSYPHELSGGMRQRVMIAMALSCSPQLLIADEPTTALDVTIQAQILELMKELREREQTSLLLITHDLGVIAEMADEVAVMYAGQVVEQASVGDLFREPLHPYTRGLLNSIPTIKTSKGARLNVVDGNVPNLLNLPPGCRFNPRCPSAMDICRESAPLLKELRGHRQARCWLY